MQTASFRSMRALVAVAAMGLASLATACSDDAESEDAGMATRTASPTSSAPVDATQASPGSSEESLAAYSALVEDVTAAFPEVALIEDTGAFEVGGGALVGDGRRVLVFGTAADLPTFVEIQQTLRGILEADGWIEDTQYAADGPTGTLSVWTKGEDMAVLAAGVAPQDPSVCPADQIIGACLEGLDPATINVQGSISVAYR